MAVISGGDALILKYPLQALEAWHVNIFPKRSIATATLDGTPTEYPLGVLAVTGTAGWSGIKQGMMIEISRSGVVYFTGTSRKDYDASNPTDLYIQWSSAGESGRGREMALYFTSGDDVTVYDVRPPWEFRSRIDTESPLFFKMGDQTVFYDDAPTVSRTGYPEPVVNIGTWQRGAVDSITGVATLTHSAAASTVWRGSSFTVNWLLPTGAALAAGYALTDTTIEVEYDPGVYIIGCTVTEVGGSTPARTRTGYRYVWAIDGTTQKDTSDLLAVVPSNDVTDFDAGRSVVLTITGAALNQTVYTGAPVLMTTRYAYSDDGWLTRENLDGVTVGTFVGYIADMGAIVDTGEQQSVTVTVVNPLLACKDLGISNQSLRIAANANRWFRSVAASGRMGHVGYFAYYLMQHHAPFILTAHDYDWRDFDDFRTRVFASNDGKLLAAVTNAATYCLGGTAACASDGSIILKREPAYETDAYNATLDLRWTLDADLLADAVAFQRNEYPPAYQASGAFAIATNTGTIEIQVGFKNLFAPGQGVDPVDIPDHTVLNNLEGAEKTGNYLQFRNAPTPAVDVELAGCQDVIDPAQPVLYGLDLSAYDAMDTGLFNIDYFTARRVVRDWIDDGQGWSVRVKPTFAPVTRGTPSLLQALPGTGGGGTGQATAIQYLSGALYPLAPYTGIWTPTIWTSQDVVLANGNERRMVSVFAAGAIGGGNLTPMSLYGDRVKRVFIELNLTLGTTINDNAFCVRLRHRQEDGSFTNLLVITFAQAVADPTLITSPITYTGNFTIRGIDLTVSSCLVASGGTLDGSVSLTRIGFEVLV